MFYLWLFDHHSLYGWTSRITLGKDFTFRGSFDLSFNSSDHRKQCCWFIHCALSQLQSLMCTQTIVPRWNASHSTLCVCMCVQCVCFSCVLLPEWESEGEWAEGDGSPGGKTQRLSGSETRNTLVAIVSHQNPEASDVSVSAAWLFTNSRLWVNCVLPMLINKAWDQGKPVLMQSHQKTLFSTAAFA